jgi:hypothetical protein
MDSLLIEFVNCDDFEGWITKSSESLCTLAKSFVLKVTRGQIGKCLAAC